MKLLLIQQVHAGTDLLPMPPPHTKTVLIKINRENVSDIYSYRRLAEWCEIERSFDLAHQLWELHFVRNCGKEFIEAYNRNTLPPISYG